MVSKASIAQHQTRLVDLHGRWIPDSGWPVERSAPKPLEDVRRFLNTVNPHSGADLFGSVSELTTWLKLEGHGEYVLTGVDLRIALAMRTVLRALTVCNLTGDVQISAQVMGPQVDSPVSLWAELTRIASGFPVTLVFGSDLQFRSVKSDFHRLVSKLLEAVFFAKRDGEWRSLKACSDVTCRWVVYDQTKNQSVEWCSSGACGGKARAKAYRARSSQRAIGSTQ